MQLFAELLLDGICVLQRSNRSPLYKGIRAYEEVPMFPDQPVSEPLWNDEITESPASHGKRLGEAAHDDCILGEFENRVRLDRFEGQSMVDLIGHDQLSKFGEVTQALCIKPCTHRI